MYEIELRTCLRGRDWDAAIEFDNEGKGCGDCFGNEGGRGWGDGNSNPIHENEKGNGYGYGRNMRGYGYGDSSGCGSGEGKLPQEENSSMFITCLIQHLIYRQSHVRD